MNSVPRKPGPEAAVVGKRRSRRHLLLLLLLPVLVATWIPVLRGKSRPPTPPSAPTATTPDSPAAAESAPAPGAETAAATPAAVVVAATGGITRRLRQLIAPFTPRWTIAAGDPFGADLGPAPQPPPSAPALPVSEDLTLVHDARFAPSAVLISPTEPPLAIIGGRCHRQGDEIQGYRIVSIEERRVVFQQDGDTFAVSIPAPTLGQEQAR